MNPQIINISLDNIVLQSIKPVIRLSKFVKINNENIIKVCKQFSTINLQYWMNASPFDLSDLNSQEKINFLFVFNSINFCYWGSPKWTIEYKEKTYDGAWGMVGSLRRAIDKEIPILQAEYLAGTSKEKLKEILRGNVVIPLFEERFKILQENAKILKQGYRGEFTNVIKKADKNALRLLQIVLSSFPSFNDFASYKGEKVFFHKRAQLLISDVFRTFKGEGYGKLNNVDQLTAFADYKIPQVLRKLGILEYSPELSLKIDYKVPILSGSEEEVEIRASSIWAIELMKEILKLEIPSITSMDIDSYLWILGQDKSPADRPYHLTRSTFY